MSSTSIAPSAGGDSEGNLSAAAAETLTVEQEAPASLLAVTTSRELPEVEANDVPEWKVENDYSYYQPLDLSRKEIRLVTIAPGAFGDPVQCALARHLAPWDGLDFEALSYCWGDLRDTVTIALRHDHKPHENPQGGADGVGSSDNQFFHITKSLHLALQYLRYRDRPRVIWIDALCINQGSIRERNYAIPFMVEVYRSASCAVVFLGEENKKHNLTRQWQLMAMLKSAAEGALPALGISGPLTHRSDIKGIVDRLNIKRRDGKSGDKDIFHIHMSLAFEDFFEYRYFQRVWVVQEVIHAKKAVVYCGEQKRDWVDILIFLCMAVRSSRSYAGAWSGSLDLRDRLPPFLWTKLLAAQKPGQQSEESQPTTLLPLIDVLSQGRAFAATDPRDKIFALLSFGQETHDIANLPPRLKPDYAKSCTEVWRDTTRQWIVDHRSLDILGVLREEVDKNNQVAQHTFVVSAQGAPPLSSAESRFTIERPPENHPTWAMWHAEHPESAQRALFRLENKISACSIPMDLGRLDKPEDGHTLALLGIEIDTIKKVQWPFKRWTYSENDMRQFNYSHDPPTSMRAGVAVAWGALIGLLQGVGDNDTQSVVAKANMKISIPSYPNGRSLLQAFIECLVCRQFGEAFFTSDDNETFDDFVRSVNSLNLAEPDKFHGEETDSKVRCREDLQIVAHFAAHWADGRGGDPKMQWIPEPFAGRLRELAKYGDSRTFTEMCQYAEGRCFFQLEKGGIGLCPQGSNAGDIVVSLSGGRTPYVLRPLGNDESGDDAGIKTDLKLQDGEVVAGQPRTWRLIGECYVHDLDISRITEGIWDEGRGSCGIFHIA